MYKLVVVAGKLRGKEFELPDGESIFGRADECDFPLIVGGVSKRHMAVSVSGGAVYIQDLGSSNGTFLNGKIIKRATVKNGDKISLPDLIFQVVEVKEKKIIIRKKVTDDDDDDVDFMTPGEMPSSILGKIIHLFKFKLMPVVHGINEEYEWKVLFGILLVIFSVATITLTIFPVLQDSKRILLFETAKRGGHFADEIARLNSRALESGNFEAINANFLDTEDGVKSYDLFDLEGRIVAPHERRNNYIEDEFSIRVKEWASKSDKSNSGRVYKKLLKDGEIGIGKKITSFNRRTGQVEAVGIIAIRFTPKSLQVEAAKSTSAYLEALMTSFLVAIIFFAIVYYLTVRPIEEMKFQIEEVLRGKRRNIDSRFLFQEMGPLRSVINAILQRNRELQSDGADDEFQEMESDDTYVQTLKEFMIGAGVAALVLDSEKNLADVNLEAEDVTGIRGSSSIGMSIMDVTREKGFAVTLIELCESSSANQGTNQQGEYELQGHGYTVNVASLMGKDGFAKAFYLTFVK